MSNHVDVKVTVWNRLHFTDGANMMKILAQVTKKGIEAIPDESLGFSHFSSLYDSEKQITVEQNAGKPTIEIYENGTLKWANSSDEQVKFCIMNHITKNAVMDYWQGQASIDPEKYLDSAGELNYTMMGEDAAEHFGVLSDDGDTDIEESIFEWATEFKLQN
jgi:hypothetical protein